MPAVHSILSVRTQPKQPRLFLGPREQSRFEIEAFLTFTLAEW
jgi:hypothetical protein